MDRAQFAERILKTEKRLYRTAVCIVMNITDAEDCVQEAILKAWGALNALNNDAYFETWLTRILINQCRALVRARGRRRESAVNTDVAAPVNDADLWLALSELDEKYRLPLALTYICGYSVHETARILSIGDGAVKWRIRRAKALLKEKLEEANI